VRRHLHLVRKANSLGWRDTSGPDYLEDAHAREFNRPYPQYDPQRFADKAREMLNTRRN